MILDNSLMFDGRITGTFAAITTTRDSQDIVDVGISGQIGGGREMSAGTDIYLLLLSNRLFAGGTSIQVAIQAAPDNGSGAEGTYVTYALSPVLTLANLNAAPGLLFPISVPRPPFGTPIPRFYKLNYTVVGAFSAGGVMAGLILPYGRDDVTYYPSGINVANV